MHILVYANPFRTRMIILARSADFASRKSGEGVGNSRAVRKVWLSRRVGQREIGCTTSESGRKSAGGEVLFPLAAGSAGSLARGVRQDTPRSDKRRRSTTSCPKCSVAIARAARRCRG